MAQILITIRGREIFAQIEKDKTGANTGFVTFGGKRAKCPLVANPIDEDGFAIPVEILKWD
jgi:hypothetical protein